MEVETDLILSDRLRELGFDFVADVLTSAIAPSAEQLLALRTGVVMPPSRDVGGVPAIGGPADGRRIMSDMRRIQFPIQRRSVVDYVRDSEPFAVETYRRERLGTDTGNFPFYIPESSGLELDAVLSRLMRFYYPCTTAAPSTP